MLKNKLIIVTGANRGVGFKLIEQLICHKDEPLLILTSRNVDLGIEAQQTLIEKYPSSQERLIYKQLDITSPGNVYSFSRWIHKRYKGFYGLVNSAVVVNRRDWDPQFFIPPESQFFTINVNFYSTVALIERMHPYLDTDGKILNMSSDLAQVKYQGERIKAFLSNDKLNRNDLMKKMKEFEQLAQVNRQEEAGYSKEIYHVSRAFLNAYTRFILAKRMKNDQSCFCVHPGWIKTKLGGWNEAPKHQGTLKVLEMDLSDCKKYNGQFFDEKGDLLSY